MKAAIPEEIIIHNPLSKERHEAWLLKVAKLILEVKVKEIIENAMKPKTNEPNDK